MQLGGASRVSTGFGAMEEGLMKEASLKTLLAVCAQLSASGRGKTRKTMKKMSHCHGPGRGDRAQRGLRTRRLSNTVMAHVVVHFQKPVGRTGQERALT